MVLPDNSGGVMPRYPFYLALDNMSQQTAGSLCEAIGPQVLGAKGHQLFDQYGAGLVRGLKEKGARSAWWDIKGHDTKDTVAQRVAVVVNAGGDAVTVHATGGIPMMRAAVATGITDVYAVMLLTSLSDNEVRRYYNREPEEIIEILVQDGLEAGVTGFITPSTQVKFLAELRDRYGKFKIVTPGTRSAGEATHDQQQVDTPLAAL